MRSGSLSDELSDSDSDERESDLGAGAFFFDFDFDFDFASGSDLSFLSFFFSTFETSLGGVLDLELSLPDSSLSVTVSLLRPCFMVEDVCERRWCDEKRVAAVKMDIDYLFIPSER